MQQALRFDALDNGSLSFVSASPSHLLALPPLNRIPLVPTTQGMHQSPPRSRAQVLMGQSAAKPSDMHEFSASLQVDKALLRFIIGKGGKTKEKIEKETSTHLYAPLPHEVKHGSALVVVKGMSQDNVDEAVVKLGHVLKEAEESPALEYSHFISLPLALHPHLVLQVSKFRNSVMNEASSSSNMPVKRDTSDGKVAQSKTKYADCQSNETEKETKDDEQFASLPPKIGHGLEESILIKPATLHLTVLMLKLWNKERVAVAAEILQGLKSKLLEALDHRPVAVRLKGVECMRGSPAKAHVLYAKVEDTDEKNRLLGACKVIRDGFLEAGLVSEKEKESELKLHLTLINSSYRKRKKGDRVGKRIPFDARPIFSKYGSEEWGEYAITEAHLSQRFAYDKDGYYHCCGVLKFPACMVSCKK